MDIVIFTRFIRRYALLGQVKELEKINSVIADFFCNRLEFDSVCMLKTTFVDDKEALSVFSGLSTKRHGSLWTIKNDLGQCFDVPTSAYVHGKPIWCTAGDGKKLDSSLHVQDYWSSIDLTPLSRFDRLSDDAVRTAIAIPGAFRGDVISVVDLLSTKHIAFNSDLANALHMISNAMAMIFMRYRQQMNRRYLSDRLIKRAMEAMSSKSNRMVIDQSKGEEEYGYEVALSFAGQDRTVVRHIAQNLNMQGIIVFFDEFEEPLSLGEELDDILPEVYLSKSLFCAVFVSRHYLTRQWCRKELDYALARQKRQRQPYILPIKLDQTVIERIPKSLVYLDFPKSNVQKISQVIVDKVFGTDLFSEERAR